MAAERRGPGAWLANLVFRAVLFLLKLLPYNWRVPLMGRFAAYVISPLAGYARRVRANLDLVCPELDEAEKRRLCRAAPDNSGRVLAELYSPEDFIARNSNLPLTGPGVAALETARAERQPVIIVSGHIGSYDALRLAFHRSGYRIGALYRPFANVYFDRHYRKSLMQIAEPIFPQGRRGLSQMLRHLKDGNMIALLTDQRPTDGAPLTFFGHTALTPLSAAEMALKYNALLVCAYGIRRANGLDIDLLVEEPVAHTDAHSMMQAVNDSLEAQVRKHMGQWLWAHRRWAVPGKRNA